MRLTKTQRKIIKEIKDIHRRKEPLNITAVKRHHPELIQAVYAVKPFWGWKKALEAAGIKYSDIKVELLDYCECEICHGHYIHLANHLLLKHKISIEDYLIDYPGVDLLSEALRAQLTIAKSNELPHWEPIWTLEYALDRLIHRYEKGLPINNAAIVGHAHEANLVLLVGDHFGSYDNALKWLGLNPDAIRCWSVPIKTKQEVLNGIAKRRHLNLPLNWEAVRNDDSLLWKAGRRLFGDWKKAIKAAGLDYSAIRTKPIYPTKGKMMKELKRRYKKGLPLTVFEMRKGKHADQALYKKALNVFHSWRQALLTAHIPYKDMPKIGPFLRFPTKESVVAEIQRRRKK